MTVHLDALCFRALDPQRLATFWSGILGWPLLADSSGTLLDPTDDTGIRFRFVQDAEPKVERNLMHLDLTSTTPEVQRQTVDQALAIGGRHLDIGQGPEIEHVVLADPEGNEFCVIEAGNNFLADCGFVGAVAGEGSQEVGYFWSEALGWPLVWDQDQETAIRSPHGGPKLTWGGPPFSTLAARSRVRFDLAAPDEHEAEVARLVGLGARRLSGEDGRTLLADPDGNEFSLSPA